MACAAYAALRAADYPEAIRIYDERLPPRSYQEADLAALGLLWRHRADFAATSEGRSAQRLPGQRLPPDRLIDAQGGWVERLRNYTAAQRQSVADGCQTLYDEADRSCPNVVGYRPPG
jgi:hypothetical protein